MEKQFNLSKKRQTLSTIDKLILNLPVEKDIYVYYTEEDVKEFIKLLKEKMPNQDLTEWKEQQELINKLAGSKLVGEKE